MAPAKDMMDVQVRVVEVYLSQNTEEVTVAIHRMEKVKDIAIGQTKLT